MLTRLMRCSNSWTMAEWKVSVEKKRNITIKETLLNNIYALKLSWNLSRRRVVHTALNSAIGYAMWVFYSAYFVRFVINSIQKNLEFTVIFKAILIIGGVTLILNVYQIYVDNVVMPVTNITIYNKLYRMLYKKAENVELACYEDDKFYNKYTMALDDASGKITTVSDQLSRILFGTLAGITSFITMYQIDKGTVLFVISPLIGNFIFGAMVNKLSFRRYKEAVPFQRKADYVNRVMYLADYSKEIRLSNIYHLLRSDYREAVKGLSNQAKQYKNKLVPIGFLQFIFSYTIIFEGVLFYGVYRTMISRSVSLADLAVLTSIMVTASYIWLGVMSSLVNLNQSGLYIHNLRHFLDYKEKIPEDYDGIMPEETINSIEFCNVSFTYKEGVDPVIKNMSFRIDGGSSVALVGHNGAGKTTIIKLLFRLYDPTEGKILVNGRNIKEYNLQAYRKLFSAAFQDYKVLADTVRYNILMGRDIDNPEEEIITSLKRAGLYDKIKSLPQGIDTILTKEFDENGEIFSGGEFQKLVVARAFANHAPIKVFDEPSSALDPIAEYDLFESILQESKNNTMLFISHRLSSVTSTDKVFMLEHGKLIESGTHKELMELGGKYADMYRMQAKNYFTVDDLKEAY